MPDNSTEIAKLEAILAAGASQIQSDGQMVTYDLAAVRKRLTELPAQDDTLRTKRPRAARINLGGF